MPNIYFLHFDALDFHLGKKKRIRRRHNELHICGPSDDQMQ